MGSWEYPFCCISGNAGKAAKLRLEALVVLLRLNAACKSYFLDALQLLSELGISRTTKEAHDPPSLLEWRTSPKGLIKRERLAFSVEVDLKPYDTVVDAIKRQIRDMLRPSGDAPSGIRRPRGCANAICAIGRDRNCISSGCRGELPESFRR